MQYLARHGKVWENIKTKQTYGDKLELKKDEKLIEYRQIPAPKREAVAPAEKPKKEKIPSIFEQEGNY